MFKHYFKTAWRNLKRNKVFSFINIFGLAIGLSVCLLIVLYVKDELSYDSYNKDADRIYRLNADLYFNGTGFNSAQSSEPLVPTLKREYPQVEQVVRLAYQWGFLVKKGNQNIQENHVVYADSTLFQVFTLPMIAGNPLTALNEPDAIVIDETAAKKYFNTVNIIGKTLLVDNNVYCKITGVMKDMPVQSSMRFSFIRPRNQHGNDANVWFSVNIYSFILLKPGVSQTRMQKAVNSTVNKYLGAQLQQMLHTSLADAEKHGSHFVFHLMPLKDIHLHSNVTDETEAVGNIEYVYILSAIAVFILLIACINFMNLSTARSANRSKEVGVRKVAGSSRRSLIVQFLTESILLSFCAMLAAISITALLIPFFNNLSGKSFHLHDLFSASLMLTMIGLIIVAGVLAGSYPAFYLSSFMPLKVLKGNVAKGFKNSRLRSVLVVFQFCISIILIVGTIVIYNQLRFIQSRQIGYNRNQVLVLHNTYYLGNKAGTFRNELLKITGVENATVTGSLPTEPVGDKEGWFKDATMDTKGTTVISNYFTDENYIPTLGMQIARGRNFSKDFPSDSFAVLLNETAAKQLFLNKNPINQSLYRINGTNADGSLRGDQYHVIGVVKDFNFSTMHENIGPLIMQFGHDYNHAVSVRINTKNISSVINTIENKWNEMVPGQPFEYSFMDADFDKMYHSEQQTGKLFITFAALAILIACLGLFGLITFAAEQRTKEIGVRKVLGASVRSIVLLLSKDFAKLILIAAVVAFPVAWWAMHKWLQSFAYKTSVSWWIFLSAGIIAVVVAFVTISWQAVKAARTNPVKSLKTE